MLSDLLPCIFRNSWTIFLKLPLLWDSYALGIWLLFLWTYVNHIFYHLSLNGTVNEMQDLSFCAYQYILSTYYRKDLILFWILWATLHMKSQVGFTMSCRNNVPIIILLQSLCFQMTRKNEWYYTYSLKSKTWLLKHS